jgi:hypothetical protein
MKDLNLNMEISQTKQNQFLNYNLYLIKVPNYAKADSKEFETLNKLKLFKKQIEALKSKLVQGSFIKSSSNIGESYQLHFTS